MNMFKTLRYSRLSYGIAAPVLLIALAPEGGVAVGEQGGEDHLLRPGPRDRTRARRTYRRVLARARPSLMFPGVTPFAKEV
jgi:hypothetical protein